MTMRIVGALVLVWLLIGVAAVIQRGYFSDNKETNCANAGTVAVTVVAGPLNYLGVNPKIKKCDLPQPSR